MWVYFRDIHPAAGRACVTTYHRSGLRWQFVPFAGDDPGFAQEMIATGIELERAAVEALFPAGKTEQMDGPLPAHAQPAAPGAENPSSPAGPADAPRSAGAEEALSA